MQPKQFEARRWASRLAILFTVGPAAGSAAAANVFWNVDRGNWSTAANWVFPAVPGPSDVAYVEYFSGGLAGLASVNSAVPTVAFIQVANGNTISVGNQGVLATTGFINVGANATGGTLRVSGSTAPGRFNVSGDLKVGVMSGFGTVDQSAGTVSVQGAVKIAESTNASTPFVGTGTYNLSGGVLAAGSLYLSVLPVSSASVLHSTLNISGTGVANVGTFVSRVNLFNGSTVNGTAVVNQTGGELNVSGSALHNGTYNMSGGKLTAGTIILASPTATIFYNGGSITTGRLEVVGTLKMGGGGVEKLLRTDTVTFSQAHPSAAIDLNDNAMIVAPEGLSYLYIQRAYNNGQWTGGGITSSAAAAAAGSPSRRTALGFGSASQIDVTTVAGQAVNPGDHLIRYTLYGDADLNRIVNIADFARLAANFNRTFVGRWSAGDFNYDDRVDIADFSLLAANFNESLDAPPLVGRGGAAVPEPAGCVAAVLAGWSLSRGRRRRGPAA